MMVLISSVPSYLMISIEWVPYLQKECGYCKITPDVHHQLEWLSSIF